MMSLQSLVATARAEVAAETLWANMSAAERTTYVLANPNSKFVETAGYIDWWERLGEQGQANYLKEHPDSKMAKQAFNHEHHAQRHRTLGDKHGALADKALKAGHKRLGNLHARKAEHHWNASDRHSQASSAAHKGDVKNVNDFATLAKHHAVGARQIGQKIQGQAAPKHGVAPKKRSSQPNLKALNKKYNQNEDVNSHSENIALLTKHFGTPEEHQIAQRIIKERNKLGWLPDKVPGLDEPVRDWQYNTHMKYIKKLTGEEPWRPTNAPAEPAEKPASAKKGPSSLSPEEQEERRAAIKEARRRDTENDNSSKFGEMKRAAKKSKSALPSFGPNYMTPEELQKNSMKEGRELNRKATEKFKAKQKAPATKSDDDFYGKHGKSVDDARKDRGVPPRRAKKAPIVKGNRTPPGKRPKPSAPDKRAMKAEHESREKDFAKPAEKAPPNIDAVRKRYDRNEDINNHSGNIALLTKTFGTPEEHQTALKIVKERNKIGHLPSKIPGLDDVMRWQWKMHEKYIRNLDEKQSQQGEAK